MFKVYSIKEWARQYFHLWLNRCPFVSGNDRNPGEGKAKRRTNWHEGKTEASIYLAITTVTRRPDYSPVDPYSNRGSLHDLGRILASTEQYDSMLLCDSLLPWIWKKQDSYNEPHILVSWIDKEVTKAIKPPITFLTKKKTLQLFHLACLRHIKNQHLLK